jgi:hypothetical protein
MPALAVFDPALCCSTGVCGPDVDEALVRFAADVEWLRQRGVEVRRHNLAQEANVFATDSVVREALQREGVGCLPLLVVEGRIVSRGRYPDRTELARMMDSDGEEAAAPAALPVRGLPMGKCLPDPGGCCGESS